MLFEIKFQAYGAQEDRWGIVSRKARADPRHLETLAADVDKVCIARDMNYSKEIFQFKTGYLCFYYMNPKLINTNLTLCFLRCSNANNEKFECFWVSTVQF